MKIIKFIKLAKNRFNSKDDYVKFQQFQASWIINNLVNKITLADKVVLDLGCGTGGYSIELSKKVKKVYALDLNIPESFPKKENIIPIKGDALNLPFKDNLIDFIFCSSLIEHISDQNKLIFEIYRVLKLRQFCYLSFPPFYSPVGGHQFKPFHLLGEKNAIILSRMFKSVEAKDYATSFGNWGLYPTTISKIKKLAKRANFRIVDIRPRFLPVNIAKIPLLGEFLTWHVEFLLQKRGD